MLAHGSDSLSLHASCCVGPSVVLGPNPTPQPRLAAVHLFGGYLGYEVSPIPQHEAPDTAPHEVQPRTWTQSPSLSLSMTA